MTIYTKLAKRVAKEKTLLCVGLDPDVEHLPQYGHTQMPQYTFCKQIIEATAEYVCAYKINIAFFEQRGEQGLLELQHVFDFITHKYPDIVTILDAKRADIGNTNRGYVDYFYNYVNADAVTLHPYLGKEALSPFLSRSDKASIILCKTSNPGSAELQNLTLSDNTPLYLHVAKQVAQHWNTNKNCMLVVGATYPKELQAVREEVGTMPILVPGVGAQGGDLKAVLQAGLTKQKDGLIITVSRAIIFASKEYNFAQIAGEQAKKYRDMIEGMRG